MAFPPFHLSFVYLNMSRVARLEKTCLQGFRPGPTQTGIYSEKKDTDQLCGYRTPDLRLCFCICKKQLFS